MAREFNREKTGLLHFGINLCRNAVFIKTETTNISYEERDSRLIRNVGIYLQNCKVSQHKRPRNITAPKFAGSRKKFHVKY
jgi:hypothetical protein